jgi:hypothetical protein
VTGINVCFNVPRTDRKSIIAFGRSYVPVGVKLKAEPVPNVFIKSAVFVCVLQKAIHEQISISTRLDVVREGLRSGIGNVDLVKAAISWRDDDFSCGCSLARVIGNQDLFFIACRVDRLSRKLFVFSDGRKYQGNLLHISVSLSAVDEVDEYAGGWRSGPLNCDIVDQNVGALASKQLLDCCVCLPSSFYKRHIRNYSSGNRSNECQTAYSDIGVQCPNLVPPITALIGLIIAVARLPMLI